MAEQIPTGGRPDERGERGGAMKEEGGVPDVPRDWPGPAAERTGNGPSPVLEGVAARFLFEAGPSGPAPETAAARAVARDEELLAAVGRGDAPPTLRIWTAPPAVVVGRHFYAARGATPPRQVAGLPLVTRASGGAFVLHGPEFLNVSWIVPARLWEPSVDTAFLLFGQTLARALSALTGRPVVLGAATGAYCESGSDLLLDGRKLAGQAQRRTARALLVHATVNRQGDPAARARWSRILEEAYRSAHLARSVSPEQIAALSEFAGPAAASASAVARQVVQETTLAWARLFREPVRFAGALPAPAACPGQGS